MRLFFLLSITYLSISILNIASAQIPVGSWRDHLTYNNGKAIATTENRTYCATQSALFYYNKSDNSITTLSKINKLSDLGISDIAFSKKTGNLIIGYLNGNIDIIDKNDNKYNFPDIKLKNIIGDKSIYNICISDSLAYLATGFGIVVFNMKKKEFGDSYIIGEGGSYLKINSCAVYNNYIYALTDNGILKGDLSNPFLGDFANWKKDTTLLYKNEKFYTSTVFNGKLYAVNNINNTDTCIVNIYNHQKWDTIFTDLRKIKSITSTDNYLTITKEWHVEVFDKNLNRIHHYSAHNAIDAIYDENKDLWIADSKKGMILTNKKYWKKIFLPQGPLSNYAFKVYRNNNNILVAPGGYQATGANLYLHANVYQFTNEKWINLTDDKENSEKLSPLRSVVDFASQNTPNNYIAGTWGYGIIEVTNGKITNIYNYKNTNGILGDYIGGMTYDKKGNLYIVNNYSSTPFTVKTPDNKWYHYKYDLNWADTGSSAINSSRKLINTYNNDKWTISSRGKGIFVWNDGGTPEYEADDVYKKFKLKNEANNLIDNILNDIVQDLEGAIWIATSNGIAVYDFPEKALSEDQFYARIPQLIEDGFYKPLLEGEFITSIAVDGANRKWIGTEGAGLFLVSADGTEQIMAWNTDNSKLFSNNIYSIDINQKTGEVFIGTDRGVQSYKSTSSENKPDYSNIFVFPNPVKDNYNGLITIRGLMYKTNVKITDISGHLVFETISNGGDAVWNGKDMSGNKVAPGVYLVFCSTGDGSMSEASKILFVK
jgi:hypothetical protein